MATADEWIETEPGHYQHAERSEVLIETCEVTQTRRGHPEERYQGWLLIIDGKPEVPYRTLVGAKRAAKYWAML